MKHKMTLEENDLRSYVEKVLAMHGVKASEEIVFRSGKGQKINGLHIDINCEMAPEDPYCPLCRKSTTVPVDASLMAPIEVTPEEAHVIETYVDKAMGESTVPPGQENADDPDDENVQSMTSLTNINARLIKEKEKEQKARRKKNPKLSRGESNRPPEPGE